MSLARRVEFVLPFTTPSGVTFVQSVARILSDVCVAGLVKDKVVAESDTCDNLICAGSGTIGINRYANEYALKRIGEIEKAVTSMKPVDTQDDLFGNRP